MHPGRIRLAVRIDQGLGGMGEIMKGLLAVIAMLVSSSLAAHDHHRVIYYASDLVPWCRDEAQAPYIAKNITPYNWTASYHDSGNMLYVDGRLRVHDTDVEVHCRIASGARLEYGVIEIQDPSL
jgi:hypothetical protein